MHFTYFLTIMTPYRAVTQLCPTLVVSQQAAYLSTLLSGWKICPTKNFNDTYCSSTTGTCTNNL